MDYSDPTGEGPQQQQQQHAQPQQGIGVERFPLAVGAFIGAAVVFTAVIAVSGPDVRDSSLTNALYGFTLAIPMIVLAYVWNAIDYRARRAPTLIFFLGAWATIFGISSTIQHFDPTAGTFFYVLCALAMAMLLVVAIGGASASSGAGAKNSRRR